MEKAGDVSIFSFTIRVPNQGNLVRTYLPESVSYTGTLSSAVDICRERKFTQTNPITGCAYNPQEHMIEFGLPSNVARGSFFKYELGYLRNPPYS